MADTNTDREVPKIDVLTLDCLETLSVRRLSEKSSCTRVSRSRHQRTRRMSSNYTATPSRTYHRARRTFNKFAEYETRISER